jgi:hypothetical protein
MIRNNDEHLYTASVLNVTLTTQNTTSPAVAIGDIPVQNKIISFKLHTLCFIISQRVDSIYIYMYISGMTDSRKQEKGEN